MNPLNFEEDSLLWHIIDLLRDEVEAARREFDFEDSYASSNRRHSALHWGEGNSMSIFLFADRLTPAAQVTLLWGEKFVARINESGAEYHWVPGEAVRDGGAQLKLLVASWREECRSALAAVLDARKHEESVAKDDTPHAGETGAPPLVREEDSFDPFLEDDFNPFDPLNKGL